MNKHTFVCHTCGKRLQVTPENYKKAYEGHTECLSCRGKKEDTHEDR